LAYLYRSCLFSVFISAKEGWGLPIGEGLWFGRPVVCSRGSSEPEVGGELADYEDISAPEALVEALTRLSTDIGYRERRAAQIANSKLRTWGDVSDDLWAALTSFA